MGSSDLARMLQDYRLTTAEIYYHLPDYPDLLQSYVWQEYDLAPKYPVLLRFLDYWSHNLDGKLHSVLLASRRIIMPAEWRHADVSLTVQ